MTGDLKNIGKIENELQIIYIFPGPFRFILNIMSQTEIEQKQEHLPPLRTGGAKVSPHVINNRWVTFTLF